MKLNVTLDEETSKAFEEVKKHMGVKGNRSVIGLMISHEEDRILRASRRKVFLPNEIYDKAEKAAKARGQMIYEYIDEMTDALLRNPLMKV
jgi:hypothetical protein